MIISHEYKFVYIKTRKTASTSIEIALSKFCGPRDIITEIVPADEKVRRSLGYRGPQNYRIGSLTLVNHMPALVARSVLGDAWGDYFTFTLERNPFDRVISQYYWELPKWQHRGATPPTLTEFLTNSPREALTNWPLYADGHTIIVDFVGRYESAKEDLRTVSERIGLPEAIEIAPIKTKDGWRKDRRHHRDVLSEEDRQLVETLCRREIDAFGYSW